MKFNKLTFLYIIVFFLTFTIDRLTKWWALAYYKSPKLVTSFFTCDLTFNRGISWSMFHSQEHTLFIAVSVVVSLITLMLAAYTIFRWYYGYRVFGEILVLSGSISNLVDRFLYSGVVDFIALSCSDLTFPIFNMADVFIVVGVGIMFVMNYKNL